MNKPAKRKVDVSIIAANYNNGSYLKDFITSVINNTVHPKELIIVDDGSTDNSLEILQEFSHLDFLKIIRFDQNKGFCNALNTGIENANGKYILRADPDDILMENRIETQYNYLENNKNIDVAGSNVIYFNSNTRKTITTSNFPVSHEKIFKEYLAGDHGIQHPTAFIRTSVMKQYKYHQQNVLAEDYELFANMIKDGHTFANIKEPLTKMRIHKKSAGSNIKLETIKKTFKLRNSLFNTNTSYLKVKLYYWYMLNYRKFMISENELLKYFYLGLSILAQPKKLMNRIKKNGLS